MMTNEAVKQVIAARLRHLLRWKRITSAELARGMNVPKGTISGYLNCTRGPQIDMLYRLAEYFGVSTDYLVGRSKCKTANREAIHKYTGLSDDAIKALKKMNQPNEEVDEILRLIDEPVIETVSTLLSTEQGRRALRHIANYLDGNFARPFAQSPDGTPNEISLLYVQSDRGNLPISVPFGVLRESMLTLISRDLHDIKEAKKHVNPQD
jgi:transcriptional regulator with XRE-family HTH domain